MGHFFQIMKTELLYSIFKESKGIAIDSRKVEKGQLFFALWGEKFNGNEFAAEALAKGASWAVIDDAAFESENTILVDDCLFELQYLATHHRKAMNVPVLAITGTNGKTTTKELLAAILSKKKKVHYTKGNLNNHIGVPITILTAPADTEMMIIEMGANHIGEIRTLCLIARPDFGMITNIGMSHIEGFGSFEGVVKAKTELYEYLRKVNGVALFNDKNPLLAAKIFRILNRAVPYSDPTGIELIVAPDASEINLKITVKYLHKVYNIASNLFGSYNLENLKAAIAAGLFFEADMKDISEAIEGYYPSNNRSEIKITDRNTLICDSYNANPASMIAALESFSALSAERKLVILGDMLELGEKSEEEHSRVLGRAGSIAEARVFLVGPLFGKAARWSGFKSFTDTEKLVVFLKNEPVSQNTVLIKGSRGMGLEKIYPLL
jgi:UDP-N-acetylmuramoyl-tripeptide--D-alanyl-D-alanine ligase